MIGETRKPIRPHPRSAQHERGREKQILIVFAVSAAAVLASAILASAQPGPIITSNNTNLVFAASTLMTNGLPGLSGPPVKLMVATVQSSSARAERCRW